MPPEHKYSLPPGSRLRQYLIVRLLGHGGFGLTYLADDTNLNRKVAIKELLPIDFAVREADGTTVVARTERDKANLEWSRQRFLEEGRTLAALHHPSILHVYDIFELHGTAYLVTDFIDGSTFEDWLRKAGDLRQEDLVSLTSSLLDALQLVHERGFLHRDIKPENILTDANTSRPVLIDFGNARMATGQKTSNITAVLTRGYAPLEQYQTKARQGPFTDIYALGAVLYRAITGAPPQDALDRLDEDKIQALSQKGKPGYTREFLATIDKALKMNRVDRWQSCREWKSALGVPDEPAGRFGSATQPGKTALTIAAVGLLALAGVGVGLWINHNSGISNLSAAANDNSASSITEPSSAVVSPAPVVAIASPSPTPAVASPAPTPSAKPEPATPSPAPGPAIAPTPAATGGAQPGRATKEAPFVNSLGMKFVPVEITGSPTNGKRVLFSIWDTRVQDYAEFARAKGITPLKPGEPAFDQGPTHPVVMVDWDDAHAFCEWLTDKEHASGMIGAQDAYRLPSDHEWSCAVGIGHREKAEARPEAKDDKLKVYPWGTQWPPPKGAGNYASDLHVDAFEYTSPVGSFAPNQYGLYDMGGNVRQWCEDFYDSKRDSRVLRGTPFHEGTRSYLQSSHREQFLPALRTSHDGFRCVLEISDG